MKKPWLIVALGLALWLVWTPAGTQERPIKAPPLATAPAQPLPGVEKLVYYLTNDARRRQGLAPLVPDPALAAAALAHSQDMLRRHYFSHVSPGGASPRERLQAVYGQQVQRGGENIWSGFGYDYHDSKQMARIIVDSWFLSPEHRANLLNPYFTRLGVGVAVSSSQVRATQIFVTLRH